MKPFDERLFILKLQEPSRWMQTETLTRRRQADYQQGRLGQGFGTGWLVKRVDSDINVLRDYLPKVDQSCRETWLSDHDAITPDFIRKELVSRIFLQIAARKGSIEGDLKLLATRTRTGGTELTPALHHLVHGINHLQGELATRYEIEAIELAKMAARKVPAPTVVAVAPAPLPQNQAGHDYQAKADLWRDFHSRFQTLADEERNEGAAKNDRFMHAYYTYKEHPEGWERGKPKQGLLCLLKRPDCGLWMLSDGVNENFRERLQTLVARAGLAVDCPRDADPLDYWLHRLLCDLRENRSKLLFADDGESGVILRACEASAIFCSRLERKALEQSESDEQQIPPSQPIERGTAEATGGRPPFDQGENLRNAILTKKARVAEIERILDRPPLVENRGRPVHGGQNWRLGLEKERQHLLIAIPELEREKERLNRTERTPGVTIVDATQEQANKESKGEPEFAHSPDYRSVALYGQTHELTERQAQVIQILHEAHANGTPELGTAFILERLETPSSRLRDTFKTNQDAWKALVVRGRRKGTLRLNLYQK